MKAAHWSSSNHQATNSSSSNGNYRSASQHHQHQQQGSQSSSSHAPSSPQIVENTLKEFYEYLKFVQDKVQQQTDAEDVRVNGQAVVVWTPQDTKRYLVRLQKFQQTLVEQIDRFPLHSETGRDIVDAIQTAVANGISSKEESNHNNNNSNSNNTSNATSGSENDILSVLRHVTHMISHISRLLQEIQLVDLDQLIDLMKHNQYAGEQMAGKDVILLLGAARAGKTTTLHYMAGSTFEEVEVEGFFHLQPASCPLPELAHFEVGSSSQREPVTQHLQTATVKRSGGMKEVVLCDTPGLSHDTHSVELDIANGLGMIRALHKARSVRPVLVMNREEMRVRERFSGGFDGETVASLATLLQKCPDIDLKPFHYVFTKYDAKHRDALCKQFAMVKTNADIMMTTGTNPQNATDSRLMRKLLDDIVRKTSPTANVVLPLEEDGTEFLNTVWEESGKIEDPKKYFVPFVSYPALKKLQLQLRITLSDLRTSLVEEDQNTAVYRLKQLNHLAMVLPEAQDCARLGVDAVKKHMTGLRDRIITSIDRKDYSMAIHRSQQLVTLAKVIPDAHKYSQVTHDSVIMLRDLTNALNSMEYQTCQDCLAKMSVLARDFPEANKCARYAMKAAVQHLVEFRERTVKMVDHLLEGNQETRRYMLLLDKLRIEMSHVISSEPLLLLCLNEDYVTLEPQDEKVLKKLAQGTGEAFCIDQVHRLIDHLCRDIPSFDRDYLDMDDMLKSKDVFLSAIDRLKILSVRMEKSPAGARADSIYRQAFTSFHDLLNSVLEDAESMYRSNWTDLEAFGQQIWFVAVLLQSPLKNKPHTGCKEHAKIEDMERRVLKMMLRLEIEVTRSMDRLKNHKFPECNKVFVKPTPIPDLRISELKAPRYLLISVAKNGRIRKLLPSKTDVLEINVCIAMFDHAMLDFWKKVVIRLEQDYAVVVQMQKVNKNPKEILQIAKVLRSDIARVEKEFLGVCGWSDDITSESEADLKRLIRIRDCVHVGVKKLEAIVESKTNGYGMNIFQCGGMSDVSEKYLCTRPKASPE